MARRDLMCQRCGGDPSKMDPPLVVQVSVGVHPDTDGPGPDPSDVEGRVPEIVHAVFSDRLPPARQRMVLCVHCFGEAVDVGRSEVTRHRARVEARRNGRTVGKETPKRRHATGGPR